ncbi:MAG: sigma 54-interacting transcriptional regulator, partial [Acidimicrobiia bacterium]
LVLTDPYVSRLHLELQLMPEGVVVVDRSSSGTFIGDWRVKEMYLVGPETLYTLGKSRLLLRQPLEGQTEGGHLTAEGGSLNTLVGTSTPMQELRSRLYKVAPVDETVLLMGETGTGKELVADAIINLSPRRDRPAVKLNCAALPRDLIESELFGVGRRVATGVEERPGKFELARGGTVFLDEIGELPLDLQAKLLRVIETGEVQRVGGKESFKGDVRVIAATNRDLKEMVQAGGFRRDLYHRLNILPIMVPSLRERRSDVPLLARQFLKEFTSAYGKSPVDISPASLERIEHYPWPGNVRELKNTIRRAAVYVDGPVIEIDKFLDWFPEPHPEQASETLPTTLAVPLRVQERRLILEALAHNGGNVAKTARQLEIGEATVRRARRDLTRALARNGGNIDQLAQELGVSPPVIRTVTSKGGP